MTWKSEMAERSRVAFNYQPFRDHYVVYSVLYPYDKDKSLLQWGSIKTLSVEVSWLTQFLFVTLTVSLTGE